ncbi:MAG: undecaprenyldiphospho-muramoylpentapeptide beta-N-acetylglucosaminyltransferase [Gammaproteobacteria bacterium]|nr:undecaprenyldiphospho-muramoylpentapeptide beta-N-acetylglucosaminyltransferase [Gammaproteobacteria bacterium]
MKKPICIMAGGTGGHIFPGLAVAEELIKRGETVHWIGSKHGLEGRLVPEKGIPMHYLAVRGLRGKHGLQRITGPIRLGVSVIQALILMLRLKPSVCVGFGGYPAGPGGIAARMMKIPVVIHEQNAVAGMTNKYLAKFATKVLTAFPDVIEGAECVGNPIRPEIDSVGRQRIADGHQPSDTTRVLVIGGSQGAKSLNEQLPEKLKTVASQFGIEVTHQTGVSGKDQVDEQYQALDLDATVVAFISRMDEAYREADIVVCRAGALTVSELASAAMPSVLIPFPYAVDDHKTKNGQQLQNAGAAVVVQEKDLDIFVAKLSDILRAPENLTQMARAARSVAKPEATQHVADRVMEVAHG